MPDCSSYDAGQCTWGACDLTGWIPPYLGNGGQWAADYRSQGGQVTMVPTVGSVVCYAAGDGYSEFGHVAVVEAVNGDGTFVVREMNYVGPFIWDTRTSNMYDVAGFLLPPGVSPGQGGSGGSGASGSGSVPANAGADVSQAWETMKLDLNIWMPDVLTSFNWLQSALYGL